MSQANGPERKDYQLYPDMIKYALSQNKKKKNRYLQNILSVASEIYNFLSSSGKFLQNKSHSEP